MDKRQQDLIREFALQAQHQQFSVSVNGFFDLNLKLLGSVNNKIYKFVSCIFHFFTFHATFSDVCINGDIFSHFDSICTVE